MKYGFGLDWMLGYVAEPLDQDCAAPNPERLTNDLYGTRARRHD